MLTSIFVVIFFVFFFSANRAGTSELESILERYMSCLKTYVENTAPQQPNRFHDLLVRLPEVRIARFVGESFK